MVLHVKLEKFSAAELRHVISKYKSKKVKREKTINEEVEESNEHEHNGEDGVKQVKFGRGMSQSDDEEPEHGPKPEFDYKRVEENDDYSTGSSDDEDEGPSNRKNIGINNYGINYSRIKHSLDEDLIPMIHLHIENGNRLNVLKKLEQEARVLYRLILEKRKSQQDLDDFNNTWQGKYPELVDEYRKYYAAYNNRQVCNEANFFDTMIRTHYHGMAHNVNGMRERFYHHHVVADDLASHLDKLHNRLHLLRTHHMVGTGVWGDKDYVNFADMYVKRSRRKVREQYKQRMPFASEKVESMLENAWVNYTSYLLQHKRKGYLEAQFEKLKMLEASKLPEAADEIEATNQEINHYLQETKREAAQYVYDANAKFLPQAKFAHYNWLLNQEINLLRNLAQKVQQQPNPANRELFKDATAQSIAGMKYLKKQLGLSEHYDNFSKNFKALISNQEHNVLDFNQKYLAQFFASQFASPSEAETRIASDSAQILATAQPAANLNTHPDQGQALTRATVQNQQMSLARTFLLSAPIIGAGMYGFSQFADSTSHSYARIAQANTQQIDAASSMLASAAHFTDSNRRLVETATDSYMQIFHPYMMMGGLLLKSMLPILQQQIGNAANRMFGRGVNKAVGSHLSKINSRFQLHSSNRRDLHMIGTLFHGQEQDPVSTIVADGDVRHYGGNLPVLNSCWQYCKISDYRPPDDQINNLMIEAPIISSPDAKAGVSATALLRYASNGEWIDYHLPVNIIEQLKKPIQLNREQLTPALIKTKIMSNFRELAQIAHLRPADKVKVLANFKVIAAMMSEAPLDFVNYRLFKHLEQMWKAHVPEAQTPSMVMGPGMKNIMANSRQASHHSETSRHMKGGSIKGGTIIDSGAYIPDWRNNNAKRRHSVASAPAADNQRSWLNTLGDMAQNFLNAQGGFNSSDSSASSASSISGYPESMHTFGSNLSSLLTDDLSDDDDENGDYDELDDESMDPIYYDDQEIPNPDPEIAEQEFREHIFPQNSWIMNHINLHNYFPQPPVAPQQVTSESINTRDERAIISRRAPASALQFYSSILPYDNNELFDKALIENNWKNFMQGNDSRQDFVDANIANVPSAIARGKKGHPRTNPLNNGMQDPPLNVGVKPKPIGGDHKSIDAVLGANATFEHNERKVDDDYYQFLNAPASQPGFNAAPVATAAPQVFPGNAVGDQPNVPPPDDGQDNDNPALDALENFGTDLWRGSTAQIGANMGDYLWRRYRNRWGPRPNNPGLPDIDTNDPRIPEEGINPNNFSNNDNGARWNGIRLAEIGESETDPYARVFDDDLNDSRITEDLSDNDLRPSWENILRRDSDASSRYVVPGANNNEEPPIPPPRRNKPTVPAEAPINFPAIPTHEPIAPPRRNKPVRPGALPIKFPSIPNSPIPGTPINSPGSRRGSLSSIASNLTNTTTDSASKPSFFGNLLNKIKDFIGINPERLKLPGEDDNSPNDSFESALPGEKTHESLLWDDGAEYPDFNENIDAPHPDFRPLRSSSPGVNINHEYGESKVGWMPAENHHVNINHNPGETGENFDSININHEPGESRIGNLPSHGNHLHLGEEPGETGENFHTVDINHNPGESEIENRPALIRPMRARDYANIMTEDESSPSRAITDFTPPDSSDSSFYEARHQGANTSFSSSDDGAAFKGYREMKNASANTSFDDESPTGFNRTHSPNDFQTAMTSFAPPSRINSPKLPFTPSSINSSRQSSPLGLNARTRPTLEVGNNEPRNPNAWDINHPLNRAMYNQEEAYMKRIPSDDNIPKSFRFMDSDSSLNTSMESHRTPPASPLAKTKTGEARKHLDRANIPYNLRKRKGVNYNETVMMNQAHHRKIRRAKGIVHGYNVNDMIHEMRCNHYMGKHSHKHVNNDHIYDHYNRFMERQQEPHNPNKYQAMGCQHCGTYTKPLFSLSTSAKRHSGGIICSECKLGKGMTKKREPLENYMHIPISANVPETAHIFNNNANYDKQEKMRNMKFESSWDQFKKSMPAYMNPDIAEHASKHYIAHGIWSNHHHNLLTSLLGSVTINHDHKSRIPEMLVTNLNALTTKYLHSLKKKKLKRTGKLDLSVFGHFDKLRNHILEHPGDLLDWSFQK